jgi:ABC-type bacteriocin/lantibiotic exporter with double-glycine peptidase domain
MGLLGRRRRPRVPFVPQMETAECGAAALAMLLAYHGHHAPLSEVREACDVSRDGASALGIVRAAATYGLAAEGVRADVRHLDDLPLPAILHWSFKHFLVLERVGARWITVVDPALGRRRVPLEEVRRMYTGVAIVAAPDDSFVERPEVRPSLRRYAGLLGRSVPTVVQLLVASLMLQLLALAFPVANQLLVDKVLTPGQEAWLWGLMAGMAAAAAARAIIGFVRGWVLQNLQTSMDLQLMGRFLEHLLHLPLTFFLQRRTGDLVQRVQSNVTVRSFFTTSSISALLDAFLLLGYAGLMVAYDVMLGAVVLGLGATRALLLWTLRHRSRQLAVAELAAAGREGGALVEAFWNMEAIKAAGAEPSVVRRWVNRQVERLNHGQKRQELDGMAGQLMVFLQGASMAAVVWLGGQQVLAERMSVGVFASFLMLQALFLAPLESLLAALSQLQYVNTHLRRLDDVMEAAREPTGTFDPGRLAGRIEVERVSFSYARHSAAVLQDLSLSIAPGEVVALVGPTGSGKSTLAQLLLGLHVPIQGMIRFDGRDLREMDLGRLRRRMGVVLQDTFLFNDTVRANLSLNDPDLPLERLQRAARLACIHDTIEALPDGYMTRIDENGRRLSVGQRQRLALARALAHDPAILLLDEATSSLDLDTEAAVQANLDALGCTRVVIAHRLATVRNADHIFVLNEGRIVQRGRYASLAVAPGLFRDLLQAGDGPAGPDPA